MGLAVGGLGQVVRSLQRRRGSAEAELGKDSSSWSLSVWLWDGKIEPGRRQAPRPGNGARVGAKASPEMAEHQEGHRIRVGTQVSRKP